MKIDEIFDSSYTLRILQDETGSIIKTVMKNQGALTVNTFYAEEDPTQIFIMAYIDGAWEVHHTVAKPGENFVSGHLINADIGANTKMIGTAKKLCQQKLGKSQSVRIVAPPHMWKTYAKIVKFLRNSVSCDVDDTEERIVDGERLISQELHPPMKLECLRNVKVPLRY